MDPWGFVGCTPVTQSGSLVPWDFRAVPIYKGRSEGTGALAACCPTWQVGKLCKDHTGSKGVTCGLE